MKHVNDDASPFFLSLFFLFVIKLNEMVQKGCVELFFHDGVCISHTSHLFLDLRKVFTSIDMS